jgi:hypothetical protein
MTNKCPHKIPNTTISSEPLNYNLCDPNKILNQNQELTCKIAKCHRILI